MELGGHGHGLLSVGGLPDHVESLHAAYHGLGRHSERGLVVHDQYREQIHDGQLSHGRWPRDRELALPVGVATRGPGWPGELGGERGVRRWPRSSSGRCPGPNRPGR